MARRVWVNDNRKTLVCVDSYDDGVLKGRFYCADQEPRSFESLTQMLVKMDAILEENQIPQSYTTARTFSSVLMPEESPAVASATRKGALATFEIQILFRQNSSWQGMVVWKEKKMEQSFRSVLEMILLLDSALRTEE